MTIAESLTRIAAGAIAGTIVSMLVFSLLRDPTRGEDAPASDLASIDDVPCAPSAVLVSNFAKQCRPDQTGQVAIAEGTDPVLLCTCGD